MVNRILWCILLVGLWCFIGIFHVAIWPDLKFRIFEEETLISAEFLGKKQYSHTEPGKSVYPLTVFYFLNLTKAKPFADTLIQKKHLGGGTTDYITDFVLKVKRGDTLIVKGTSYDKCIVHEYGGKMISTKTMRKGLPLWLKTAFLLFVELILLFLTYRYIRLITNR